MTPLDLAELHARASDSPWNEQSFKELLAQDGAILAARPNAFAMGRVTLDEAELLQIATDPAYQRQGFGKEVLAAFEDMAHKAKCARLLLEVSVLNVPAIGLYTSAGWRRDGTRAKYYRLKNGQRVDAFLMSKSI
ncbi:GNAT family N-acetyltransferase [Planktotalea sp.]|uniref:GNAT family N-acetyltransferase n=1 Tax=Planktotalea sp. TaxID=2029877 RepID=UPI003F6D1422